MTFIDKVSETFGFRALGFHSLESKLWIHITKKQKQIVLIMISTA